MDDVAALGFHHVDEVEVLAMTLFQFRHPGEDWATADKPVFRAQAAEQVEALGAFGYTITKEDAR